ncbi:MAG: hypothetical protein AAGU05_09485, partial [Anaerolineaceae bacterium]
EKSRDSKIKTTALKDIPFQDSHPFCKVSAIILPAGLLFDRSDGSAVRITGPTSAAPAAARE